MRSLLWGDLDWEGGGEGEVYKGGEVGMVWGWGWEELDLPILILVSDGYETGARLVSTLLFQVSSVTEVRGLQKHLRVSPVRQRNRDDKMNTREKAYTQTIFLL